MHSLNTFLDNKKILLDTPDNQPHTGCYVAMVISFLYVSQFLVRCLRDARHIGCPPEPRRSSQQITPNFRIGITCLLLGRTFEMLKYLKATDFESLVVGAVVEFDSERGPEGLRAVNIQRLVA
jgi:hypothetical protein